MYNFLHVAVLREDELNQSIKEKECSSVVDCDFDLAQEFDYAQTVLINESIGITKVIK